jgi:hypothetical protein
VTVTAVSGEVAKARQISAAPNCVLVRCTKAHVNPAPATPETVELEEDELSAEMKARSNSFGEVVENDEVLTVVLDEVASREVVASIAIAAFTGTMKKPRVSVDRAICTKRRDRFMSLPIFIYTSMRKSKSNRFLRCRRHEECDSG